MTYGIILLWSSIICNKIAFKLPVWIIVLLVFAFSFVVLPEIHLLPHGIKINSITSIYQVVILSFMSVFLILVPKYSTNFLISILSSYLAIILIIQTNDWFNMYVAFELLIISFFIIGVEVGWSKRYEYFEYQVIASSFVLVGIIRMYAINTNLNINQLTDIFWSIGIIMKIGVWPFHNIPKMYLSIENHYMYIFATCILSKALFCILPFAANDVVNFFLIGNLVKSTEISLKSSSIDNLQLSNLMNSNTIIGFLVVRGLDYLAATYVLLFLINQILFVIGYKRIALFLVSGMPFSLSFFLKIFIK